MVNCLRFGAVVLAVCAPAAAYVVFVALTGGEFWGDLGRLLGIDRLLRQLALSLLFAVPPVIWLAFAAARRDPAARRPGLTALVLMPLALVLAWLIFALVFLASSYALGPIKPTLGWVPDVSLTDGVDVFAASLGLCLLTGLYVLSGMARRLRGLRLYAFLAPCVLAPAALTGIWLGLHAPASAEGVSVAMRIPEIVASDISGHFPPVLRYYMSLLAAGWWDEPEFYLGLPQLAAVLLLAVLPVVIALNVLRYPARRPHALMAALIVAWVVHLPSDAILVYSDWYDTIVVGSYGHTLAYATGPVIRLLAVMGAVGLTIHGQVTEAGDRKTAST